MLVVLLGGLDAQIVVAAQIDLIVGRRLLVLAGDRGDILFLAAFQIGIVLASAEVITGIVALVFAGGLLGAVGAVLLGFGYIAPHALPFFH